MKTCIISRIVPLAALIQGIWEGTREVTGGVFFAQERVGDSFLKWLCMQQESKGICAEEAHRIYYGSW